MANPQPWWKNAVIYQIYPRSFQDSNGDGIGDLAGIIQRLGYLESLGIDAIWLSPVYRSPQDDNGYDISDYTAVNPVFGDMADFEEMVRVAKEHKIDFMLDMVLNHCSTEHEWFQKALAGDKYYQDFFFIQDQPTDWLSKFGGSAWAPFGDTGKYYLHLFDETQADLNWRNPNVRRELFKVVNFWRDKGVKGFRFDVINLIGKDEVLVDCPENEGKPAYTDKPIVHDYLHMMNEATFGADDSFMTVGEMSSTTIDNCVLYSAPERHELSMAFNFHHLKVDYEDGQKWTITPFDFEELKRLYHTWGKEMSERGGWSALFWNNHDLPRILSMWGDTGVYREKSAKALAILLHLMRGTPYIYQGEEIGMTNYPFQTLDQVNDIESLNNAKEALEKGTPLEVIMDQIRHVGRDNARTPMQWDTSKNAGFSSAEQTWLAVNPNYKDINVASALANPDSIFYTYQKLVELRKTQDWLIDADFELLETVDKVFAYIRRTQDSSYLVVVNLSDQEQDFDYDFDKAEVVIANTELEPIADQGKLQAWDAICVKVK